MKIPFKGNQLQVPEDGNTGKIIFQKGRYTDNPTPFTRLPVSYLKWMVNNKHEYGKIAEFELVRRGTSFPTLEVSGHAIDRASTRLLHLWQKERLNKEGLYAWLVRISEQALQEGYIPYNNPQQRVYNNIRFAFEFEGKWPILKTVMLQSNKRR